MFGRNYSLLVIHVLSILTDTLRNGDPRDNQSPTPSGSNMSFWCNNASRGFLASAFWPCCLQCLPAFLGIAGDWQLLGNWHISYDIFLFRSCSISLSKVLSMTGMAERWSGGILRIPPTLLSWSLSYSPNIPPISLLPAFFEAISGWIIDEGYGAGSQFYSLFSELFFAKTQGLSPVRGVTETANIH